MVRLYYRLFYQLHCFFCATAREGWEETKALIAVNGLCAFVVIAGWVWTDLAVKQALGSSITLDVHPLLVAGPVAFVIAGANNRLFLYHDRWKCYAQQFQAESAKQRRAAAWGTFALVLGVVGNLVGAFYCMSRVDWHH